MSQEFFVGGGNYNYSKSGIGSKRRFILFGSITLVVLFSLLLAYSQFFKNNNNPESVAKKFYSIILKGESTNSYNMFSDEAKEYMSFAPWESKVTALKGTYKPSPVKMTKSEEIQVGQKKYQKISFEVKDIYYNNANYTVYLYKNNAEEWVVQSYSLEVVI